MRGCLKAWKAWLTPKDGFIDAVGRLYRFMIMIIIIFFVIIIFCFIFIKLFLFLFRPADLDKEREKGEGVYADILKGKAYESAKEVNKSLPLF